MFALKMYSQNDKNDVLDSMQQNFLSCPNLKIFSMDFTIQWWYLCEFLEKKKKKSNKSQNFCFYHYQVFPKSQRGNRKLKKK